MQIKEKYIYFNGEFVLWDDAKIHGEKICLTGLFM